MSRARALRAREKLASKLLVTGELLRGSLLERTNRQAAHLDHCEADFNVQRDERATGLLFV
jgi:hypothetical protein